MEKASLRPGARSRSAPLLAQILSASLLLFLVAGLALAHRLRSSAAGESEPTALPEAWVDPRGAHVTAAPSWVDPRWLEHLEIVLARQVPLGVGAAGALEPVCAELAALSFVERVERCELSAARGLELDLVLREPVACIPVGDEFALVDEDGVVLEGHWPDAPRLGRAWLPILGPRADPLFARARAGDWLAEPEHLDALDVALSLAEHLGEERRAGLGRIVIDARAARRTSVVDPGVRLELEGARAALFGRAPSTDEPGELDAASKWAALARALELFERDPSGGDWGLVDLRWDRPDLALRHAPAVAALADDGPPARGRPTRARGAPEDARPRVRLRVAEGPRIDPAPPASCADAAPPQAPGSPPEGVRSSASGRLLAAAFLLSILVPLGEALLPGVPLVRGSLSALALLPWLVLGPLPRSRPDGPAPAWRAALALACLALPPLCLGAGVDLARGAEPRVLAATLSAAWVVLLLWSWAAERAVRAARTGAAYAALWFVLLPGASALCFALAWVPLRAGAAAPGRAPLLAIDPLLWCHRWGRAGGLAELALVELALAVGGALLAGGIVLALGRAGSAEGSP